MTWGEYGMATTRTNTMYDDNEVGYIAAVCIFLWLLPLFAETLKAEMRSLENLVQQTSTTPSKVHPTVTCIHILSSAGAMEGPSGGVEGAEAAGVGDGVRESLGYNALI